MRRRVAELARLVGRGLDHWLARGHVAGERMQNQRVMDQRPFDRPILSLGLPRSGTTWVGKILDSHPLTLYRHEPDTWQRLDDVPLFSSPEPTPEIRRRLREFIAALPEMRADRVCGKRPLFPKAYASAASVRMYSVRSFVHRALGRLAIDSGEPLPPHPDPGVPYRLALKSIESLGRAGLFANCIPEARSVHIVRHPCGYVASVLRGEQRKRFDHNEAASEFELYRLACDTATARRYGIDLEQLKGVSPVERLAWRWLIFNEKAHDELATCPGATTLYYEHLCAEPMIVARSLFEFVELDWNAQAEGFVAASTTAARSDYYSVFKNPLESAWRWRREFDRGDAARVMAVVSRSPVARPYLEPRDWNRAA